jgi:hypothetical protein
MPPALRLALEGLAARDDTTLSAAARKALEAGLSHVVLDGGGCR